MRALIILALVAAYVYGFSHPLKLLLSVIIAGVIVAFVFGLMCVLKWTPAQPLDDDIHNLELMDAE